MKIANLVLIILISIFAASVAYGADNQNSKERPQRLLPLHLTAPTTVEAGVPFVGISVNLLNPGEDATDARLRLIIHEKDHKHFGDHYELSPDTVKVEVLEGESWKPVILRMGNEAVLGTIGPEGVTEHRELYNHGGFAIPAGLNKTWQLRLTFSIPGTYTIVVAVSPDNGATQLARPAHSIIVVQ